MFTQGDGLLPLPLPPMPLLVTDRNWKPNVESAPNCPRCCSSNTKFCYYNNYSLTQPRYFCKSCRRYWTKGGSLRNIPVGGGCRKSRRGRPVRISSNSPTSGNFYTQNGSSMAAASAEGARSDASTIDLALLYTKFLNHQPVSDPRLVMPEGPSEFNPSSNFFRPPAPAPLSSSAILKPNADQHVMFLQEENGGARQCPSDRSTESHLNEVHRVFLGGLDMSHTHKQQERVPEFMMSLGNNGYGQDEEQAVQAMFWSNHPTPPLPNWNFPLQATQMQRCGTVAPPVAEEQPILRSNPLNGNNWSSFDLLKSCESISWP